MKRSIIHALSLLALLLQWSLASESVQIRQQFIAYHTAAPQQESTISWHMEKQKSNGTWPDINYTSKRRGSWETLEHLNRLSDMAAAYADQKSALHDDPDLREAILHGLEHWIEKDYRNPNWWYARIGVPRQMLSAFILLDDDLPAPMIKQAQGSVLKRTKMGMTGQNKVWLAGIAFQKALLSNDAEGMQKASDTIWSELRVTTKEGIQPDGSFHQHGPQQQFGNYGSSFGASMIQWGSILHGTDYALAGEKLEILRNYQLNGPSWLIWKGRLDLSGCGRQIDAHCQGSKGRGLTNQLKGMMLIDPKHKAKYEAALSRVGHKSFWRSDMAVHRRPSWYASVKMSSTRIIGSETCNSENMLGRHLGDGTLLIHLNGKEYEDIQPLWDWHRLPGTTCDQGDDNLTPKSHNKTYGGSDFAGVLGDETTGLAAMVYKSGKLEARKAWFFGTNSVTCLGAGITGESAGPVFTSIQQSRLKDSAEISTGRLKHGTQSLKPGSWIYDAGIGYHLLDSTACRSGKVKGNWQPIFPTRGDRPASGDILSLWVNHRANPTNQTYAYTIFPNTKYSLMPELIKNHDARILSNTATLQAIETSRGIQAVFYSACTLTTSRNIKVDAPCLLSLDDHQLIVADPTHKLSTLTVTIDGQPQTINLPAGDSAGKQVTIP
jgi:chondroitin AC lyase